MDKRATSEEIILSVKIDLRRRKITLTKAAEMLGVTLGAVTNQLSGARSFGRNSARKYAETFGYSETFLLSGMGTLYGEETQETSPVQTPREKIEIPAETAEMYTSMAKSIEMLSSLLQRYAPVGLTEEVKKSTYIPDRWVKK